VNEAKKDALLGALQRLGYKSEPSDRYGTYSASCYHVLERSNWLTEVPAGGSHPTGDPDPEYKVRLLLLNFEVEADRESLNSASAAAGVRGAVHRLSNNPTEVFIVWK